MAEETEIAETPIPVRYRVPSKLPSVVGQHFSINQTQDGVLLSFFEIIPPMVSGELTEGQQEELAEMGIIAECVSKVFVPLPRIFGFAKILNAIIDGMIEQVPEQDRETLREMAGYDTK